MPIPKDAHSLPLKILRSLPANRFGLSLAHFVGSAATAKLGATLEQKTVQIPRRDGTGQIRTLVISPKEATGPLPIVVHYHGGGYIIATPESAFNRAVLFQQTVPCILVMPDYRLAKDAPFPAGHDDCYDTLLWASENAETLGGAPDKIGIAGESAGGGLTLSTALRARDEGRVSPAFMMPIYPMIEDREAGWTDIPARDLSWNPAFNRMGWDMLLNGDRGGKDVSIYAAPARCDDYSGLPPALTFIGACDMFLAETRSMVDKLRKAGVDVTYKEFPEAYHGLEVIAPKARLAAEINRFYADGFKRLIEITC